MYDANSPFAARPVSVRSEQDAACARLREAIQTCELMPGVVVSEGDLSRRFAFGKAAVRTALARLSEHGLVAALPRRGWQIAPLSGAEIRRLAEARRRIEPALAEIALDIGEAARLRRIADLVGAAGRHADGVASAVGFDRDLRTTLAHKLGNPYLARWIEDLWQRSGRVLALDPARPPRDPGPLIDALADRRRDDAQDWIARDIQAFERDATAIVLARAHLTASPIPGSGGMRLPGPFTSKETYR